MNNSIVYLPIVNKLWDALKRHKSWLRKFLLA
jgi:hypothetical protein